MDVLNPIEASLGMDDDLLNFTLDGEEELQKTIYNSTGHFPTSQSTKPPSTISRTETRTASFPEFVEEELEWLSDKDAFPSVETCFGILADNPELMLNRHSPVSVLESSSSISSNSNSNSINITNGGSTIASLFGSFKFPANSGRTRSKRRRKTAGFCDFPSKQCLWSNGAKLDNKSFSLQPSPGMMKNRVSMGRRCLHCQTDKTPQWRAGPMGPKTLCNACGVRYKSGRLLPEYRPASSPTFSSTLHSNSHRKVVEMRRHKLMVVDGVAGDEGCGYEVGG